MALAVRRRRTVNFSINADGTAQAPDSPERTNTNTTIALLGWWIVSSFAAFSIAGEKMPWLTYHLTWPLILFGAWGLGWLLDTTELKLAVVGRFAARGLARVVGEMPVKIPAGGTARVRIAAPPSPLAGNFQLELSDPPDGIVLQSFSPTRDGAELVLQCGASKAKPGLQGNLIVNAVTSRGGATGKAKAPANQRRLATLPAIPFEIVAM